jgi:hypothetical protein
MIRFWNLALLLVVSGCASTSRRTEEFLRAPTEIPQSVRLTKVTFIEQSQDFCGPAALSMAMGAAGPAFSMEKIGTQTFTPGKAGTLQSDMLGASRRNRLLALPVTSVPDLLREVAAGNPVVVFQNLALSWYPKWHYAVAVGYDLKEREVILHSGPKAFTRVSFRRFESEWKGGHYWGLVVLPPSRLSPTASELDHATAAAALETLGLNEEALSAYESVLSRWPSSLGAYIGIANVRYAKHDWLGAVKALKDATRLHSESGMAWHNLALAQESARQTRSARRSAERAIKEANDAETESAYRLSLASLLN